MTADGKIGPGTLAAISKAPAPALLAEFMARRMLSYGLLQKLFKTFGLGWSRRLMATHTAARALLVPRLRTPPNPPTFEIIP